MSAYWGRTTAGLLLVWAVLNPRSAWAENASESLDSSEKASEAVRLGHEGRQLFELAEYPAALERFRAAERSAHSPVFTLHMARCLKQLGRWTEAREGLSRMTGEPLPEGAPPPWQAAKADAVLELKALERELPRFSLTVSGLPESEVSVILDDRPVRLPLSELLLDPGHHEVTAHRGQRAQTATFTLTPGTHHSLVLRFDSAELTPSEPSRAPESTPQSAPQASEKPSASARRDPRDPWFWTAVGVSGASLAVGGVSGALALANVHTLDCPGGICTGDDQLKLERTRRLADVATVSLILAGTAAATAVTILVLNSRSDAGGARVAVGLGAGSLSLRCNL